jgi:16S rRNA processing protein RimM
MAGSAGPTTQKNMGRFSRSSGGGKPELRYLAIGRVVRAHGLRGEVSVTILTEFPERFKTTEWVYLGNEFEATPYRLESYRWHKKNILLTLASVTDRTQAEELKGQLVQVPVEEAVPLPEGAYYLYQLIGLEAITTTGQRLGVITDILETGANDVYVVKNNAVGNNGIENNGLASKEREILLPAIADVVKSVDLEKGQIIVEVIDGLI